MSTFDEAVIIVICIIALIWYFLHPPPR